MKKLICVLFVSVLLLSAACSGTGVSSVPESVLSVVSEAPIEPVSSEAPVPVEPSSEASVLSEPEQETQSEPKPVIRHEFSGNVHTTVDWTNLTYTVDFVDFTYSFELPDTWKRYSSDDPSFYAPYKNDTIKTFEVSPVVLLSEGQGLPGYLGGESASTEGNERYTGVFTGSVVTSAGEREYALWVEMAYPGGGLIDVWYPCVFWMRVGSYAYGFCVYAHSVDLTDESWKRPMLDIAASLEVTIK